MKHTSVLICLCHEVSLQQLQAAIHAGATTVTQLTATTGAGSHCGKCLLQLENLLPPPSRPKPS